MLTERLFQEETHSVEEWADIFHLSITTTQNYFKKMQTQLAHFNLTLSFHPVRMQGNEMDIRNFYFSFFYESDITPYTVFPTVAIQQAVNEMGQLFNKDNYHFSSFTLTTYLLLISIERYLRVIESKSPKIFF
ncbi:helix-turn-helix domain-containing protein [Enterococcus casseliflavus]|uniref:helix-turn-helix domain-containing protein n=1 Tax=Enterococcus TaxID=1350 RepID=UPI00232DCD0D|nr:helix-turn-helix domain-containing protein [Enterococcus casseliflavus]MDB1690103.1 helix-turn-helix domain-containing protein [Enterococcus casseliflavus]